ncbi:MAG TPA: hypothetical protein VFM88_19145 [Vicinamibacteria bacterium]|nr:hypothetical protein [Vicinamibacteria bacterium]
MRKGDNVLDRTEGAVVWIDSPISRRHARIVVTEGGATIEGSKGQIMAVDVSPEPPPRVSSARLLFEHRYEALNHWFEELERLVAAR